MTLKIEQSWITRCTECGQVTVHYGDARPNPGTPCDRCAVIQSLGIGTGAVVGVRVDVMTMMAPDLLGALSFTPGLPIVRLTQGTGQSLHAQSHGFSCRAEDIGLWTPRLGADRRKIGESSILADLSVAQGERP